MIMKILFVFVVQRFIYTQSLLDFDLVEWRNFRTSPGSGSKGEQITVTSGLSLEAWPGHRQMANLRRH